MRKRIVALLLVINMLASIMLCLNGGTFAGVEQMFSASAAGVDTASYSVGDTILYGNYEQDKNTSNGKEPIEWIVIDTSGDKLLLISKYGLMTRKYNMDYDEKRVDEWRTTWEKCKLRAYLNNDFFNAAFSEEESSHICYNTITNKKNAQYGTSGGNSTVDRVYLLSHDELTTYLKSSSLRKLKPTKSAKVAALDTDSSGYCLWWLRTPGRHAGNAEYVMYNGNAYQFGSDVGHYLCVRPVIRIQQDAVKVTESIELNSESMTVKATDNVALSATITPADSCSPVTWSSSNTKVAKVDSKGKVTIVGLGKVTISVKSGGFSDSCELTVLPGYNLKAVGGSVRVTDPYGLRFGIQLMKDSAYSKSSKSIVTYGTLIIPKKTLGDAELTLSTPNVMKIKASNIYSSDSKQLTYTGVLVGIPSSSFDDEIVGRGYLTYKDADGTKHTIYTDVIVRTYRQVAEAAYQRYAAMTDRNKTEQTVFERLESIINTINGTDDNIVTSTDVSAAVVSKSDIPEPPVTSEENELQTIPSGTDVAE